MPSASFVLGCFSTFQFVFLDCRSLATVAVCPGSINIEQKCGCSGRHTPKQLGLGRRYPHGFQHCVAKRRSHSNTTAVELLPKIHSKKSRKQNQPQYNSVPTKKQVHKLAGRQTNYAPPAATSLARGCTRTQCVLELNTLYRYKAHRWLRSA